MFTHLSHHLVFHFVKFLISSSFSTMEGVPDLREDPLFFAIPDKRGLFRRLEERAETIPDAEVLLFCLNNGCCNDAGEPFLSKYAIERIRSRQEFTLLHNVLRDNLMRELFLWGTTFDVCSLRFSNDMYEIYKDIRDHRYPEFEKLPYCQHLYKGIKKFTAKYPRIYTTMFLNLENMMLNFGFVPIDDFTITPIDIEL